MQKLQTRFSYFSVLFFFLIASCSCKSVPQPLPDAGNTKEATLPKTLSDKAKEAKGKLIVEYQLRQQMQKRFISDACSIAKETADKEALDICAYLKANVITSMNIGSELITFDTETKNQPIPMLVVMGDELSEIGLSLNENLIAAVLPLRPTPLMIVRVKFLSRLVGGIVVLHEGEHARFFYSLPKDSPALTPLEMALEEVRAYEFQIRLIGKIGGKKYAAVVADMVERLKKNGPPMTEEESEKLGESHFASIDEIFGTSDDAERRFFLSMIYLESKFQLVDQSLPDKELAANVKAAIYLSSVEGGPKKIKKLL